MYLPFWTYYCHTDTAYTGERGEYYYTTETYTETDSSGNSVQRTREVQHTRWDPASGTVSGDFNNVLVPATKAVPEARLNKLEPWDLNALCGYEPGYLAGFRAQRYQIELAEGFDNAKAIMARATNSVCCLPILPTQGSSSCTFCCRCGSELTGFRVRSITWWSTPEPEMSRANGHTVPGR